MKKLSTDELRELFLKFFEAKAHKIFKSDSLVPAGDPSVLFTSAGMNQFKEYFLDKPKDFSRVASCQKCLRTADLDEVGETAFHHTFFEMLGNFSFGDYFKKEAIEWAWEFVTRKLGIAEDRLWVSVYEEDQEAYDIWKGHIRVPPAKIKKFGQKENFWPSNAIIDGPNGPCGPCSEIYYKNENGESVELWNLVFTQYNRSDKGELKPLANKNIDTGMGLERMSSVLQGVDSNFKIDIFVPIVEAVKRETGASSEKILYAIADHVRAVSFAICDGVMPSNDGRGYVVRKLIRRSIYIAEIENPKPFLYKIVSSISKTMGKAYPELLERRDNIAQIIKAEEEKYKRNILEGDVKLGSVASSMLACQIQELPPEEGYDLYVTFGVQPEFTKEYCEKKGIRVDIDKINSLIEKEQARSRGASKMSDSIFSKEGIDFKKSQFIGYEHNSSQAKIVQIIKDGKEVKEIKDDGGDFCLVLDKTPFYGEAGGQIGDRGQIILDNTKLSLTVIDTIKQGASTLHLIKGSKGAATSKDRIAVGSKVVASVDIEHRSAVKRAHTATHILQAALRKILGPHVQQAGSLVEADKFRFDFTHFQDIKPQEMQNIQQLLNDLVIKNDFLEQKLMPKQEAQKIGAIALFGEKYEDTVRVVSIAGYSKEFCGGTHLDYTGKIGYILICSESSVGSGLRRIEALTGRLAYQKVEEYLKILEDAASRLKVKQEEFPAVLEQFIAKQKSLEKECLRLREGELKAEVENMAGRAKSIEGISLVTYEFKNFDVSLLRRAVDLLKAKISSKGVFFLSSEQESGAYFVCGLTADLVKRGLSADSMLKKVLIPLGGSGGGRGDLAQGGIKKGNKASSVLRDAEKVIKGELKEV